MNISSTNSDSDSFPSSIAADTPETQVVLAAIRDSQGRYLISLRGAHLRGGSHWEFPGGKVEAGESLLEAVRREVAEEVNLEIDAFKYLRQYSPSPQSSRPNLRLHLFEASHWRGCLHHNLGQEIQWRYPLEIATLPLLPDSLPLLDCLRCAPLICITPLWHPDEFSPSLRDQIFVNIKNLKRESGERAMLLWRQPDWDAPAQTQALTEIMPRAQAEQVSVCVAHNADVAESCQADFIHLNSAQLTNDEGLNLSLGSGAAVHNQAQLRHARLAKLNYVLISPLFPTPSKAHAKTLGWSGFAELAQNFAGLAYALGGVGLEDLLNARQVGGFGIAGIRYWWQ